MSMFKENITKFFSIESFGVEEQQEIREDIDYDDDRRFFISRPKKHKTEYKQFFVGSFEYNVTSIFKNYSKKIYLPILFSKDNVSALKELLEYYDNLKFKLTFIDKYKKAYTKKYHISEFINFDKIFKAEYKKIYDAGNMVIRGYYIELYLDYNDEYEILLTQQSRFDHYIEDWRQIFLNQNVVDNLCSSDTERKCLEYIRENYEDFPVGLGSFKVLYLGDYAPTCGSCYSHHLKDAIKNILENTEKRIKDKNDRDAIMASLYSKTSYMLVENKVL